MFPHWKCCQFVCPALSKLGPLPAGLEPQLWLEAAAGIPSVREWLSSPWLGQLPPADGWLWVMVKSEGNWGCILVNHCRQSLAGMIGGIAELLQL